MQHKTISTSCRESLRVHVRWIIRRDMPEILAIEGAAFEYTWTEADFLRVLGQRNCIGMVAEHGEKVVGFMIYELQKVTLHLLNFAVCPNHRRRGVGAAMVQKLTSKLSSHLRTRITVDVRESNLNAHLFFKASRFEAREILRGHYEDEDAYRFVYEIA